MITFEVHPEIHVRELRDHPFLFDLFGVSRSFHAKSEDQLSLFLCERCLDAMQSHSEPVISVHVRPAPAACATL
jgi:hypothetical protein